MYTAVDHQFMSQALAEAHNALYLSNPNPRVGCIIVKDGEVIGRGHTQRVGGPHAEVQALADVKSKGLDPVGSTVYVTLEPCNHTGRTPPCVDAIIEAGIAKVIYAVSDPNPIAAGGAQKLRDAGIAVEQIESADLEYAQRAWLRKEATGRPLMIWKVATTIDSKVAASDGTSQWISGPESREDVQKLRAQSDAILIGTNTALVDNPHLIPKGHAARPVRIICGEQEVPPTHQVFDDQARTILVKSKSLPELISVLKEEKFNQVLVEAGPTLGSSLMASGNIDELIVYQAPKILGAGKEFVSDLGISTLADHIELELISAEVMGSDVKSHYRVVKGR